uniref:FecR/PupR family sigma factor regulator n=1 Tax=Alcaligenes nematophilus TaxID=2994643 RepID=UPI00384FB8C9
MSPSSSSPSDAVRTQANQWWVRLHSGSARQSDAQSFQRWLEQSPEHRVAWQPARSCLSGAFTSSHAPFQSLHF